MALGRGRVEVVSAGFLPPLVLASGSPRRKELLRGLGLQFEIRPAEIDETPLPGEPAGELVARLSEAKGRRVAASEPGSLVIAADTVVVSEEEVLGKPVDRRENESFLRRLSGRKHKVYTGHFLSRNEDRAARVRCTDVWFRDLTDGEIERYLRGGEGLDKAGGYGIQGRGAALVSRLEGCYFNVVGLSLATVVELARELGVDLV